MTTIIQTIRLLLATQKPVLGRFQRMMFTLLTWPVRIVFWLVGAVLGAVVGGVVQGWRDGMDS